jgi:osmotically-inducible protein OsmY
MRQNVERSGIQGWLDDAPADRTSHAGRGPKGYRRSDERIHEEVCEVLTRHPGVDASEVEVRVEGGEVTLAGTVPDRRMKRLAEDLAADCAGVVDVHNQVRVTRAG